MGDHSWRTSWREELANSDYSNGNASSNGNGVYHDDLYTASSNGNGNGNNGYYDHEEPQHANGWAYQQEDTSNGYYNARDDVDVHSGWQHEEHYATHHEEQQHEEEEEAEAGGFFTSAFKDALKDALSRSPLYGNGGGSGDEENVPPQPGEAVTLPGTSTSLFTNQFQSVLKEAMARRQAELDGYSGFASDDEDPVVAKPYVPAPPPPKEMSPIEEVLATALGSSQMSLRRLGLMQKEIEAAIEREAKQVERLEFAMNKIKTDEAYYATLQKMLDQQQQRR